MAKLSQAELERHLWQAADILRGHVDAGDYKQYIFGLLFYKRLCDVWDEEFEKLLAETGDRKEAADPDEHRFHIPPKHRWDAVRKQSTQIGQHLNMAFAAIEDANLRLRGVFGDVDFANHERFLNAVFPLLKAEWLLTDAQLGALSGVVALMVGVLTFPLSLLADRWGRIRSLVIMAALWSLATLACGLAQNYGQMLLGRMFVGVGEAAYGSVGIAVVLTVFPARMRATIASAFMAGALFGQVLGIGLGGQAAAAFGWRWAFAVIALAALSLTFVYPFVVRERWIKASSTSLHEHHSETGSAVSPSLRSLFANRAVVCAYIANGLQFYVAGTIPAWLPTYFTRYYGLGIGRAGSLAALFLLTGAAGMVLCGMLSDRLARHRPERKIDLAIGYCLTCALLIVAAFLFQPGVPQLALLGAATFIAAGTAGPAGAMVANLTPRAIHGTAFATLTLANNLLGLAPGPALTGRLADAIGLVGALRLLPIACLLSTAAFLVARTTYRADLSRVTASLVMET